MHCFIPKCQIICMFSIYSMSKIHFQRLNICNENLKKNKKRNLLCFVRAMFHFHFPKIQINSFVHDNHPLLLMFGLSRAILPRFQFPANYISRQLYYRSIEYTRITRCTHCFIAEILFWKERVSIICIVDILHLPASTNTVLIQSVSILSLPYLNASNWYQIHSVISKQFQ